jgi:c-di-GMP-binding flagellar brake protein YcgR
MMQIKRKFVRWQMEREAKVKLAGALAYADCVIHDLSFMGVKITLAIKLPTDTFLKMKIQLSETFIIDVEAWSVWHKSVNGHNCYGLYFSRIKELDKEKIYQFLRLHYPEQLIAQWWQEPKKEKGGENMEDRRVFARFNITTPVRFMSAQAGIDGTGETSDVSAKGVGMLTDKNLEPRTPVELWLSAPDQGEPIYTRGEVVWSREVIPGQYRVGVNLDKADLMGMSRMLR